LLTRLSRSVSTRRGLGRDALGGLGRQEQVDRLRLWTIGATTLPCTLLNTIVEYGHDRDKYKGKFDAIREETFARQKIARSVISSAGSEPPWRCRPSRSRPHHLVV
jgi:hypothetical protein